MTKLTIPPSYKMLYCTWLAIHSKTRCYVLQLLCKVYSTFVTQRCTIWQFWVHIWKKASPVALQVLPVLHWYCVMCENRALPCSPIKMLVFSVPHIVLLLVMNSFGDTLSMPCFALLVGMALTSNFVHIATDQPWSIGNEFCLLRSSRIQMNNYFRKMMITNGFKTSCTNVLPEAVW